MQAIKLVMGLAWRNLWRNRRRSLLTMLAIFVAVFSMVVLGAFMRAWSNASLIETINNLTGHGQVHNALYLSDPSVDHRMVAPDQAFYETLTSSGATQIAQRIRVPAMIRSERESVPVELYGIQPQSESKMSFIAEAVVEGTYFENNNERGIIIGELLAKRLQTKLGRRLVIMSQGSKGDIREMGARVVAIFDGQPGMEKSLAFITIEQAQSLLQVGSDINEVVFRVEGLQQVNPTVARLKKELPHVDVLAWDELQPFTKAMVEMGEGGILIWIFVSFGVVSFGLISTLLTAVFERMREFGLLQAVGMKPHWLVMQILFESIFMVGVATLIGAAAGSLLVMAYADGLDLGVGANYFGAAQTVYPELDWGEVQMITWLVLLLGILASLYPALKAARQVPVDVLSRANN